MKSTAILLLGTFSTAFTQSTNPLFPSHAFTIRGPEPCDSDCQSTICTTEGYCTPCGSGICIGTEECGTWVGKANHCCIQPFNFDPSGTKLKCSDAAGYLSALDVTSAGAGAQPKTYTADVCPSGEVIAAYEVFGDIKDGNLTCCTQGQDVIILESGTLSVPESILCVDEVSAGASGSGGSGGTGSEGKSGSGGSTPNGGSGPRLGGWLLLGSIVVAGAFVL
ncbi:hypothetical protein H072_5817 [Dactylellina haptotyla CBS 200.50]|uniref:Uncharacterized protein n=1 Tax=Dactylellina haptotyla (strain CBS 200.50) TaxID=1284197 RepID=S8ABU9_DACHA|nr:hypothetical protein H072_5817 [Dactylellina haptotyla CBS 200.50]